jgi:hypothetical protein
MAMWRCPHCATPQPEASRCWVCHRSSTSCATCRHFRRSIAAQIGYCGLDRHRRPLTGEEIRACWDAAPPQDAASPEAGADVAVRTNVRGLAFVPVGEVTALAAAGSPARRSLWGDPERE